MELKKFILVFLTVFMLVACSSDAPQLKPLSSSDVIVAFGDSLTAGTGTPKNESYPAVLARITGRRVVNAGVSGEETAGGLKRIHQVLEEYHPSLVILCLGGNDQLRKRSPEQIKENLGKLILIIKYSGADVLLLATPRPSIALTVPDYYAELGREFKIPVDTTTLRDLLRQGNKKSDYIHLNAAGYKELAEAIAGRLKEAGAL